MAPEANPPLLRSFAFRVVLHKSAQAAAGTVAADVDTRAAKLADGAFQEVTGLELEMEVKEQREGGRNDGVVRLPGPARLTNITLKRGMFCEKDGGVNRALWQWLQDVLSGTLPLRRYDGVIEVLDGTAGGKGAVLATWQFYRGLPSKISGPQLNAKTGEIAIEELVIAHEGLRLVSN